MALLSTLTFQYALKLDTGILVWFSKTDILTDSKIDMLQQKSLLFEHIDGLMQERRNSSALAMKLRLSCINPSILRPVGAP